MDPYARNVFETAKASIEDITTLSTVELINVDKKKVAALQAWMKTEEAHWAKAREKALAKVKCPKATNKNKKLTKKLRKVLTAHAETTKKKGSTLKETMHKFGLAGKATQKREAFKRVLHEDLPAFSCVEQVRGKDQTCRIFEITFRRSKPDGGRWGDWGFYSVGGGGEMLCSNLRK
jgi:hypothetical protein